MGCGAVFLFFGFSDEFFYSLDMSAAEALDFAAEFEVTFDFFVIEDAEAIDDGEGIAGPFDDVVGIEVEIRLMGDGEDEGVDIIEGGF